MPVPEEDIVCRFVRSKDWSEREQRPKPTAFKDLNLSVWHPGRLQAHGAQLADLQFGNLVQTGEAHYMAEDFGRIAKAEERADVAGGTLDVTVEWAPETVVDEWKQWAHAHMEVRTETNCKALWARFRRALCVRARMVVPPSPKADVESISA